MDSSREIDNSIDPRDDANHLTLYHYPQKAPATHQFYFKVKIPGGGNCGFYSVALALLNILVQDKLLVGAKIYADLIQLIKNPEDPAKEKSQARKDIENRLTYFESGVNPQDRNFRGGQLKICVRPMRDILRAIDAGQLDTPEAFKAFVIDSSLIPNHGYYFVESLMLVLGPALRQMTTVAKSAFRPVGAGSVRIEDADGENVTAEQLNLLAAYLNCHLITYSEDPAHPFFSEFHGYGVPPPQAIKEEEKSDELEEEKGPKLKLPSMTNKIEIVNIREIHWDLLVPLDELQKPPFFFANFKSEMLAARLTLEILTSRQFESRIKAGRLNEDFQQDSYVLVKGEQGWDLFYVDEKFIPKAIPINQIPGLDEALIPLFDSQEDAKPVETVIKKYLGINDTQALMKQLQPHLDEAKELAHRYYGLHVALQKFKSGLSGCPESHQEIGRPLVIALENQLNTLFLDDKGDASLIEAKRLAFEKCLDNFKTASYLAESVKSPHWYAKFSPLPTKIQSMITALKKDFQAFSPPKIRQTPGGPR